MKQSAGNRTAVTGAGTMGGGIAETLAKAGYPVVLYDIDKEALKRGIDAIQTRLDRRVKKGKMTATDAEELMGKIMPVTDRERLADVQLIIEAALERLDVKQELFAYLDDLTDQETILATNTSSLSVTEIASAATQHPERVLGLHFFNPAPVMPLVEVVSGVQTDPSVLDQAVAWMHDLGKSPVRVKDTPGFVVNRVARPFHNEAYRLVGDRVATKEQVDRVLRSAGFPMGPFELQDMIGIDINFAATTSVYDGMFQEPRFRPHPGQRAMVDSGAIGRKAGRGHYSYER